MPFGHDGAHLLAAAALLLTGGPILALAWRRRGRRQAGAIPPSADPHGAVRSAIAALIAACSLGAGAIHIGVVGEHEGMAAAFFIGIAAVQVVTGALWVRRPGPRLATVLTIANLGTIVVWAWSRSLGLPFLPEQPEPIGRADVIATVFEGVVVLAIELWLVHERLPRRVVARLGAAAALVPVPALGLALILTLLAFAPLGDRPQHAHGAGDVGLHWQ
ncbi:MAG: hypothetical protein M3Z65_05315 [Chloroflexota bacterium]|nr:hypothetical protein [Chloroflexota bacterium]